MSKPELDPKSLSVEERLDLIDALWRSIEEAVASGDTGAAKAVDRWTDIDADFLAALEREADEAERDPSTLVDWETLVAELTQEKRG